MSVFTRTSLMTLFFCVSLISVPALANIDESQTDLYYANGMLMDLSERKAHIIGVRVKFNSVCGRFYFFQRRFYILFYSDPDYVVSFGEFKLEVQQS